mgnify:CR=1 FL=1
MTKKDYELLASEFYKNKNLLGLQFPIVIEILCGALRKDNALFNPEKFARACCEGKHIRKSIQI